MPLSLLYDDIVDDETAIKKLFLMDAYPYSHFTLPTIITEAEAKRLTNTHTQINKNTIAQKRYYYSLKQTFKLDFHRHLKQFTKL